MVPGERPVTAWEVPLTVWSWVKKVAKVEEVDTSRRYVVAQLTVTTNTVMSVAVTEEKLGDEGIDGAVAGVAWFPVDEGALVSCELTLLSRAK